MSTAFTADGILLDICQHPGDDFPRIIYSDFLEERGEGERAEFIRVQLGLTKVLACLAGSVEYDCEGLELPEEDWCKFCKWRKREGELLEAHWTDWYSPFPADVAVCANIYPGPPSLYPSYLFSRGFVSQISLSTESFVGGSCSKCEGRGYIEYLLSHDVRRTCISCNGTGKTEGYAEALFRSHPLQRVILPDRIPHCRLGDSPHWSNDVRDNPCFLPLELFELVPGNSPHPSYKNYFSDGEALEALGVGCPLFGRRKAWPCPVCKGRGKTYIAGGGESEDDPDCISCSGTGHTVSP